MSVTRASEASRTGPRKSLRLRILSIALTPALVGVLLATIYFTTRAVKRAEQDLYHRGQELAQRLAKAVEYELFVGDSVAIKKLLEQERALRGALALGVANNEGRWEGFSGDSRLLLASKAMVAPSHLRRENHWLFVAPVQPPVADGVDPYLSAPPGQALGVVEVVLDDAPLLRTHIETLWAAAGISLLLMALSGILAWRMSDHLGRSLLALSRAVERITGGDLAARVEVASDGELGALEAGVNRMAATLEENRGELEQRIRAATSELRQQTWAAESAVLAKSRFLAAASHDLRQPLHAMTLLIAALKDRIGDGEARRLVEHVEASAAAMESLLNALLDLSRLDAGAVEVRPECFSVAPLFRRLEQRFAPVAAEKGLRLRVMPTRMNVMSDPILVERILGNLLSNAIQYTDRGGVVLGVRRGRGESMRFEVWDSGRGVPTQLRERIFEEYFQLDNPERHRDKGLGLGLAIVDRLSRLLGCPVRLRSELGRGSCFSLCAERCDAPTKAPNGESDPPPGRIGSGDALVVFVDDDESILEAMLDLFDNWQVELAVGTDAHEVAADLLELGRAPSLILCDYRLRDGQDGIEAIAFLRRRFGADIPALLITGDTAAETLARIHATGLPLLNKPLQPAKLRAILAHYLGTRG